MDASLIINHLEPGHPDYRGLVISAIQLFLQGKLHMAKVDAKFPAPDREEGDVICVETLGKRQDHRVRPSY